MIEKTTKSAVSRIRLRPPPIIMAIGKPLESTPKISVTPNREAKVFNVNYPAEQYKKRAEGK